MDSYQLKKGGTREEKIFKRDGALENERRDGVNSIDLFKYWASFDPVKVKKMRTCP